ncbi:MAG: peptidase dimerization domain-containing protein, partial [Thermoleophilum sp.]|nr:peptidase dimerization domain-containing protein [Thermoleophilum sp.]
TASDRELRALLEPMLGVTFAPTMARGSAKINVIPARAELAVDCRVPPGVDRDEALAVVREVVGDSGAELELDEATDGSLSAPEGTLYEFIAAFCAREDPAAQPVPTLLPGFTDSRWFRATFPNCAAYGFFPQLAMEMTEASALIHGADERVPVADLGLAAAFYAEAAATLLA